MSASGNLPEGTPIVCRRCGGSMHLEGASSAVCRFCGARDELPADEAGRYLEIRGRLNAARARAGQVQGMEAALSRIFEDRRAFLRVSGVYLGTGVVILAVSTASLLMSGVMSNPALSWNLKAQLLLGQLSGPMLVFGLAASFGLALLGGRAHYRREVRPHLLARPIDMGGAGFACRACGGPIATGTDISVTCRFCGSMNLIPGELHGASSEALRRHAAEAERTVSATGVRVASIATRMEWILGAGIALTVLLAYGLPGLLGKMLGTGAP